MTSNNQLSRSGKNEISIERVLSSYASDMYNPELPGCIYGEELLPIKYEEKKINLVIGHFRSLSSDQIYSLLCENEHRSESSFLIRFGDCFIRSPKFRYNVINELVSRKYNDIDILRMFPKALLDAVVLYYDISRERGSASEIRNETNIYSHTAALQLFIESATEFYDSHNIETTIMLGSALASLEILPPEQTIAAIHNILNSNYKSNLMDRLITEAIANVCQTDFESFKGVLNSFLDISQPGEWPTTMTFFIATLKNLDSATLTDFLNELPLGKKNELINQLFFSLSKAEKDENRIFFQKTNTPGIMVITSITSEDFIDQNFHQTKDGKELFRIDGLWFFKKNGVDKDDVFDKILHYNRLREELIEFMLNDDSDGRSLSLDVISIDFQSVRVISAPKDLALEIKEVEEDLNNLLSKKLDLDDITYDRPDLTNDERVLRFNDFKDFSFLISKHSLKILSEIYNIDFQLLSLEELFAYTRFAKNAGSDEVRQLKKITNEFGLDAISAFLASDYDKNLALNILNLPNILSHEACREIFRLFSNLIQNCNNFFQNASIPNSREQYQLNSFIAQFKEAFVRRFQYLISSFDQEKFDQSSNYSDIINSFNGLNLVLKILNDLQNNHLFKISEIDAEKINSSKNNFIYEVIDPSTGYTYKLKLMFREFCELDSKGRTLPARINIELDFNTDSPNSNLFNSFKHTIISQGKSKDVSILRVGLDLDERESSNFLSLDMGRGYFRGENFSCSGCILGKLQQNIDKYGTGHHNFNSFSTNFVNPNFFSLVVQHYRELLKRKS